MVGEFQHALDLVFARAVEHRRRHRHAFAQIGRELDDLAVVQGLQVFLLSARLVIDRVEEGAHLLHSALRIEHAADLEAQALGGPSEMGLEHLADVHT